MLINTLIKPGAEQKSFVAPEGMKAEVSGRTIVGYFATWEVDRVGDTIDQRAFVKTFNERGPRHSGSDFLGSRIKIDFNHDKIIGVPLRLDYDSKGAIYEGRIQETPLGDDILARVKNQDLDMNSFVYDVLDDEPVKSSSDTLINGGYMVRHRRHLKELRVHFVGPVDAACNEGAGILGLKSFSHAEAHQWLTIVSELKAVHGNTVLTDPTTLLALLEDRKAGRRLSSASEALLDIAITALSELRGTVGVPASEDDDPADKSPPPEAEPKDGTQNQNEQKALADILRGLRL